MRERYEWWVLAREVEVVCEQQMAGVRGRNVVAIVCGDRVPVREHIAGDKEIAWL